MRPVVLGLLLGIASLSLGCAGASGADGADDLGEGETSEDALTEPFPFKNGLDKKVYPTNKDRDLACPVTATRADGYRPAVADVDDVEVDGRLTGVVPQDFRVAVILVRRVNGIPHYRYVSNGTQDVVFQPWSSTKWMAATNAAAHLRELSGSAVGLTASTNGIPLGDLVTGIHTYTPHTSSSNALSRFMHDVGGRARAKALVTGWIGRTGESFGGNYGELAPPLPMTFREPDGQTASVVKDTASGYENQLSALTMAEFAKRIVMHREDALTRMPGLQWKDLRVLFYGAEDSKWYPGKWGGMSADKAIYVQSALDMPRVEADAKGQWRIFSKVGFGTPTDPSRGNGEFVEVSYACLPKLDAAGKPIPNAGREVIIAAMQGRGGADASNRDKLFADSHAKVMRKVLDGSLD